MNGRNRIGARAMAATACAVLAALSGGAAAQQQAGEPPCYEARDLLLVNGRIHTMDAQRSVVSAARVLGERFVAHGTQAHRLPEHYRRYLENTFLDAFGLRGTPVRLELRSGENPFASKRNPLTRRQRKRRRRVMRHGRR